ncbi:MAG: carbohydrate ABC transporter permease [Anaerolineaceae bacterium]|nr:carbohydrate ABC transporter permease [Anaerolineaceae bacterium]
MTAGTVDTGLTAAATPSGGRTIRSRRVQTVQLLLQVVFYVALIGGSVMYAIPFFWMIRASLLSPDMFHEIPPPLIPNPPAWNNYADVWEVGPVLSWVANSTIVSFVGVTVGTFVSALVAFGFARLRFPGNRLLFIIVISTMMLPQHVTIIPQVILFRELNWLDTLLPLIVPLLGGAPFYIFLLRQFFLTLPLELDEAAAIDGASRMRVFWTVVIPLSKPAIATVAVFSFINHWNDFFFPLIVLQSAEKLTLAVGMRWLQAGQYEAQRLHLQMAIALIAVAPVIIVFFLAQKHFIRGIALTGIKG